MGTENKIYEYKVIIEAYIVFDSDDIPENMTPDEYAEQQYIDFEMQIDSHEIVEL